MFEAKETRGEKKNNVVKTEGEIKKAKGPKPSLKPSGCQLKGQMQRERPQKNP